MLYEDLIEEHYLGKRILIQLFFFFFKESNMSPREIVIDG